nr:hypothetical protein [Tanacetum cinerariifolium]
MRYVGFHTGENNVSPFMHMQEACNQEEMYTLQNVFWESLMSQKTVQSEEPEFKVGDTDTCQSQEGNLGNNDVEPKKEFASKCDWFTKPSRPQEPTDLDWNVDTTPQKGPTQNWLMTLAASTYTDKSLKDFD